MNMFKSNCSFWSFLDFWCCCCYWTHETNLTSWKLKLIDLSFVYTPRGECDVNKRLICTLAVFSCSFTTLWWKSKSLLSKAETKALLFSTSPDNCYYETIEATSIPRKSSTFHWALSKISDGFTPSWGLILLLSLLHYMFFKLLELLLFSYWSMKPCMCLPL